MATLADLRSAILSDTGCTTAELPYSTIDRWMSEASAKIHTYTTWNWLDTTWELSTASIYTDYSEIVTSEGYTPKHPRNIMIDDNRLNWISEEELREALGVWGNRTGEPTHWSTRSGQTLILAPEPDTAYELTITGLRARKDWVAGNQAAAVPDMPDDFHVLLEYYGLFRGHMRKRDPETAMTYWGMFTQLIELLDKDLNAGHHGNKPIIMNRGQWNKDRSTRTFPSLGGRRGGPQIVYVT